MYCSKVRSSAQQFELIQKLKPELRTDRSAAISIGYHLQNIYTKVGFSPALKVNKNESSYFDRDFLAQNIFDIWDFLSQQNYC